MKTIKSFMISTSIVLILSIAIASTGVDASMKVQLQNAVGTQEPCQGVCTHECGGQVNECYYCTYGQEYAPSCQLEGDVLADDTYDVCYGTSASKYCRFNHTLSCGNKYFCASTWYSLNAKCVGLECESDSNYRYCRQCNIGDLWPGGAIQADDEVCQ